MNDRRDFLKGLMAIPSVAAVERLDVEAATRPIGEEPGERTVLFVKVPQSATPEELMRLRKDMVEFFARYDIDIPVVVLAGDVELSAIKVSPVKK